MLQLADNRAAAVTDWLNEQGLKALIHAMETRTGERPHAFGSSIDTASHCPSGEAEIWERGFKPVNLRSVPPRAESV